MTATAVATGTWLAIKGPNGDLTWRVESPSHALGMKVNYIPDESGGDQLMWPNESAEFPWTMTGTFDDGTPANISSREGWEQACNEHGQLIGAHSVYPSLEGEAAVFTRPLSWLAAHMIEMRSQGIRVSAECDDNYLAKAAFNPFTHKWTKTKDAGESWDEYGEDHSRSICSGDALILSTEHLRDQYWRYLKARFGKKNLPEFHVCRNHVDRRFMPAHHVPPRDDGKLRIGYMGSDSHYWDVELIYPALQEAFDLGHEIVFVGINPRYSMMQPSEYENRSRQHWWNLEYTHVPWSNTFRGVALPLDIGFAPLVSNHATDGKSDIKALEYALSGAACVAQNTVVYNRTLKHGDHVMLAGSPAEYVLQMRELIRNRKLREDLVGATMTYIEKHRMIEDNVGEWRQAVFGE